MIIFTNGVFDVLTPAHFNLLLRCRQLARDDGEVHIALDTDEKVKKDKGIYRPIFTLEERKHAIKSIADPHFLGCNASLVDYTYSFNTNEELYSLIKEIKPDLIVKSDQWKHYVVGSDICEVSFFHTLPEFSTSKIVDRIIDNYIEEIR